MAGSSEKLIQAQQERTSVNELFANSIFSNTTESHENSAYLLDKLHQTKEEFVQYSESFDANTDWRCLRVIVSSICSSVACFALFINFNAWYGVFSLIGTLALVFYYIFSHTNRNNYRFLTFFKKGKRIANSIEEYKKKLLPIISNKEFQFKILYQLQMLAQKIAHDTPKVNQGWIMEKHNELLISFNSQNYEDAYTTLAEIYQNHDLIHNQLLEKINLITYKEELKEFVQKQTENDQALPFEHHVLQLKQLL